MHDLPARPAAEQLRLWPVLEELVRRIAADGAYEAAMLMGSLARGEGDALSDIDLGVVIRDGCFEEAWSRRYTLSAGALHKWDDTEPGRAEWGMHAWLTPELVKVELPMTTTVGRALLADPFEVIWGDPAAADRLERVAPFSREEIEAYAAERRTVGRVDEIERLYGDLKRALRARHA